MKELTRGRDTLVIGASAGGIAALRALLASLHRDLAASVLIVVHQDISSRLAEVLQPVCPLPIESVQGELALTPGRVYLATPDRHMVMVEDRVTAIRGPLENRSRPAINPLFRSAAVARNSRVIAVLLTGLLDDGVAGLAAVKRCGGLTLVQDPAEAEYPDMPRQAIEAGVADQVLTLAAISEVLHARVGEQVGPVIVPRDLMIEAQFSISPPEHATTFLDEVGERVLIACPECGGMLWKTGRSEAAVYRCYLGHVLSSSNLMQHLSEDVEVALWTAARILSERATMLHKLADDDEHRSRGKGMAAIYRKRAAEAAAQSDHVRNFLVSLRMGEGEHPHTDDGGNTSL